MRTLKLVIFSFLFFFCTWLHAQWCCLDTLIPIKDKSTISDRLFINGAANNDLSSPNQGLCGVRIKFDHKFIGDVIIELIAPSGQKIRLLGPLGNSGRTDFTKWFISFVPCGSPAIPDLGFKAKWDNLQSWGILGKFYNGTYYPNMGCLEDFNIGPVNGTWTLSVSDAEKFYEGKIESFCLLFCDQTGINCQDCSPNGGYFKETNKSYCLNDPDLQISDRVEFPVFIPDTGKYGYKYLLSRNDTLIALSDQIDLRSYPVGHYEICGLSYLRIDSSLLPLPGQILSTFRQDVISNNLNFCAELSKNCLDIDIHPFYTGSIQNIRLCTGDSLIIDGEVYKQTGVYSLNLKSVNQCDSNVILNLDIVDLKIQSKTLDTIDCDQPVVSIDISSSILTSKSTIQWSTVDGQFTDLSDSLVAKVNKEGSYTVLVEDGTCIDSAQFLIIRNEAIPDLAIISDTINCVQNISVLKATTNGKNPKFNWSDGMLSLGNRDTLHVQNGGLYYLTITDENGCSNYASVEVIKDTVPAIIELFADVLTCKDTIAKVQFKADKSAQSLLWTGPFGFSSFQDSISVENKGFYKLRHTSINGCISIDSVEVISEIIVPEYFFTLDTLNCWNNKQFTLQDRTSAMVDSIIFRGPGTYYAKGLHPILSEPGMYFVSLTDVNGCVLDTGFTVVSDTLTPQFSLSAESLSCSADSVQLFVHHFTDSLRLQYQWLGPVGFSRIDKSPYTKEEGLYTLIVSGPNGCSNSDTIRVVQDDSKPDITISNPDTLNCKTKQVKLIAQSQKGVNFMWFGPANFVSSLQDPLINNSGLYKVVVTAANGCTSERSVDVMKDTISPIGNIIFDSISCIKDSAFLQLFLQHNYDSLLWTGPFGFQNQNETVHVFQSGMYRLFVRGTNGCIDSSSIQVVSDTLKPSFRLKADTLDCSLVRGSILLLTQDTAVMYEWKLPSGATINTQNVNNATAGWYSVTARKNNGCEYSDSIEVLDFSDRPVFQFIKDSITCLNPKALIGLTSKEQGLSYSWKGPGGFISIDSIFQTDVSGWYTVTVTNSFNCQSEDSVFIPEYLMGPIIAFSSPRFDCRNKDSASLTASWKDSLVRYQWVDPSGQISTQKTIPVQQSGNYFFSAIDKNGCQSFDTLLVQFDTLTPRIITIYTDTLNCIKDSILPLVEVMPVNVSFLWSGPGLSPTNKPNPVLRNGGLYALQITGPNFCVLDTVLKIEVDTTIPVIDAVGGTITCENMRVQLSVSSQDSLPIVIWQGPKGENYPEKNPFVMDSGWYRCVVQAANGCFAWDSVLVVSDTKSPDLFVQDAVIPCNKDSIELFAVVSDSLAGYAWFGPNQYFSNKLRPFVKDTGYYELVVTGRNKCITRDTIHVSYRRDTPIVNAITDTLSCKNPKATLEGNCTANPCRFTWTGPSFFDTLNLKIQVDIPGIYVFHVMDSFGCVRDTSLEVRMDTIRPVADILLLDSFICDQNKVRLTFQNPSPMIRADWSSVDGVILGSTTQDTLLVASTGNYRLILHNSINGCADTANLNLQEIPADLGPVQLHLTEPSCFDSKDGQIIVDNVKGGFGPLKLSLNGMPIQLSQIVDQLGEGSYTLEIKDRFGCRLDTVLKLSNPSKLFLDVGRDTVLKLGARLTVSPQTNANTNRLQSVQWTPASWLDCPTCFEVKVTPQATIQYVLQIVDEKGCVAEDSILITLILAPDIFIPNAISPNQDDINDKIKIQLGPEVEMILQFSIFDRWGNKVYHIERLPPQSESLLWDGQWNGHKLNPGVFVYYLEARLVNGGIIRKTGDITLFR